VNARRWAIAIFFGMAGLLAILQANRFVLTNDEGILLEPARWMAQGARPYVDFFGYMSPGSYWIQTALFWLLGMSFWVGRVPVIFDLSLQCALLFWLTQRISSQRAGWAAALIFGGFQMADPAFLTAQHRWDSGTLALMSVCVALRIPSKRGLAAAGVLLAMAAWCTPSMVLAGVAMGLWLLFSAERRSWFVPFLGGIAAVTAGAVGWLAWEGALTNFVKQMLWLQKNYSAVNVMPYGSVLGGYAKIFEDAQGADYFLRLIFVGCLALPAILPPLGLLMWGVAHLRGKVPEDLRPAIALLLLLTPALVVTAFPRADLFHLALVSVLPYALVAAAFARFVTLRAGAIVAFTMIPLALLFSANNVISFSASQRVATPVGTLRMKDDLALEMRNVMAQVRPGQSLFVHSYLPILYFVTQAKNPTGYPYLVPGMMTAEDEANALKDLQARPPQWFLYLPLTPAEFQRVLPSGKNVNPRFDKLETWLEQNYRPLQQPEVSVGGYRLWERRPDVSGLTLSLKPGLTLLLKH
jgi:hypothetical protein